MTEQGAAVSEDKNLTPLNRVRAIFVGDTATGKTSLIRRLNGEPVIAGEEKETQGVEIREWSVPDSPIKAKLWDFAGKPMAHASHQLFLRARCLYVVLVDTNASEQAEYWLAHIQSFAKSAPVLLVRNKIDLEKDALNSGALTKKYPNIVGVHSLSSLSKADEFAQNFVQFSEDFSQQLKALGTHEILFSANQFAALDKIRDLCRQNALLDQEKFDEICEEYAIGEQGFDKITFVRLLDDIGELIHFSTLKWSEAYVLNPRWLTYGIYTLLYSDDIIRQKGVLRHADVARILQAETVQDEQGNHINFTKEKLRFITDVLKQFRLRYQLPIAGSFYAIIDRFVEEKPNLKGYFNKQDAGTLSLSFHFSGLLPRSMMPKIIAILHDDIAQNVQDEELVWRYGVILEHESYQAKACWTVDYQQNTLTLWVQGEDAEIYLQILRDEAQKIFDTFKELSISTSSITRVENKQKKAEDIIVTASIEEAVENLKQSLATIKHTVEKHDADFFVRVSAYGDLQRIEMQLGGIEKASSDPEKTLQLLLDSIQDDSLGVMKLAKEIKAADEAVAQLKQNAKAVSDLLL
ncbi:MAG: hypothetical protein DSZ29_07625 [Aquificaceae bacterium]|nr:MAG: hypothetical protein DSZ29_07625 [Aquificaceae bacterium]